MEDNLLFKIIDDGVVIITVKGNIIGILSRLNIFLEWLSTYDEIRIKHKWIDTSDSAYEVYRIYGPNEYMPIIYLKLSDHLKPLEYKKCT